MSVCDHCQYCSYCHSDVGSLKNAIKELEALETWKREAFAVWNAADDKLRPLLKDVPGSLGQNVYIIAAEEIERLRRGLRSLILSHPNHFAAEVIEAKGLLPSPTGNPYQAARLRAGLTIQEAAKKAKIGYTTIWNYEDGMCHPAMDLGLRLATAYGCTLDELAAS